MTMTIHKFPLKLTGRRTSIKMPATAKPLTVQAQRDQPQLWVQLDTAPDLPLVNWYFTICGTGDVVDEAAGEYLATFQMHHGDYVWHVYATHL